MIAKPPSGSCSWPSAWLGPVVFVANRLYLGRSKPPCGRASARGGPGSATNLAENITGTRVVTAFDRQTPNLGAFNRLQVDNTANNVDRQPASTASTCRRSTSSGSSAGSSSTASADT